MDHCTNSYKLAKYFEVWFKWVTDFQHPSSLKNSIVLSEMFTLTRLPPSPGSILIIFDIVGPFFHVPLQPTCELIEELLAEATHFPLLWSPNLSPSFGAASAPICQFNNIYKRPPVIGILICSPLGSHKSEVFMTKLENKLIITHVPLRRWYVDHILRVWTGPTQSP